MFPELCVQRRTPIGIIPIILSQTPRYSFLFKLNPEDYESWAYGLKKAGYATNNRYSQILIQLIREYDLQKYSLIALGKQPEEDNLAIGIQRESIPGFLDSALQKSVPVTTYPEGPFSINEAKVILCKSRRFTSFTLKSVRYPVGSPAGI